MSDNPAIPKQYRGEGKTAYRLRLEKKLDVMRGYASNERFSRAQRTGFRVTADDLQREINRLLTPGEK